MRIAVIGSGGIGGYYGGLLREAGHEVTFVARGAHLAALRLTGLRIESALRDPVTLRVRATDDPEEAGPADLVLFAVKSYDTASAAALLPPLLHEATAVLTLQNGVENVGALVAAVGREHVLGGLCYVFSTIAAPGVIRHSGGPRRVVFGELDGSLTPRAERIRDAFAATGVPVELSREIAVAMWEKFVFIVAEGGMTALTRLPIGEILSVPETRAMLRDAAEEAAAVGRARGVALPAGQGERVIRTAEALEPDVRSSLYADLASGRRMELEALQGAVVRMGRERGVPTPLCRAIYAALLPYHVAAQRPAG